MSPELITVIFTCVIMGIFILFKIGEIIYVIVDNYLN